MSRGCARAWAGWLLALGIVCTHASMAHAYHGADSQLTTDSAYTLPKGQTRLGLWRLDQGVADGLHVGTYPPLWLLYAANVHVKWRFWQSQHWAAATRVGLTRLDLSRLGPVSDDSDAIFSVVPLELAIARAWGDTYVWNLMFVYTHVGVRGQTGQDALEGAAAVTNAQWVNTFQWNLSRTFALLGQLRTLIFQRAQANLRLQWQLDEFTEAQLQAEGDSSVLDVERGTSLILSGQWSWEQFNLRLGLSLGNYNVPAVNFVVPRRFVVPELDVYWRF